AGEDTELHNILYRRGGKRRGFHLLANFPHAAHGPADTRLPRHREGSPLIHAFHGQRPFKARGRSIPLGLIVDSRGETRHSLVLAHQLHDSVLPTPPEVARVPLGPQGHVALILLLLASDRLQEQIRDGPAPLRNGWDGK